MLNRVFVTLLLVLSLSGCDSKKMSNHLQKTIKDPLDRDINLTAQEYKDNLRPQKDSAKQNPKDEECDIEIQSDNRTLDYADTILSPEAPDVTSTRTVTMSVTEDIPIKNVLIELARLSDMEVAIDPAIDGGIILKVKDRPVREVVEMIAEQASLRYSINNGVLKVEKDSPYLVSYPVDFMNLIRSSKSSVQLQTQVLNVKPTTSSGSGSSGGSGNSGSSGGGGSGSNSGDQQGLNSGSSSQITASYDGDLWRSIEENLRTIIYAKGSTFVKEGEAKVESSDTNYYTVNRQANVINVMSTAKKHRSIKKYLDSVAKSMSAQVLIEAKIVEVALSEAYSAGIDWQAGGLKNYNLKYGGTFDSSMFSGAISNSQFQLQHSAIPAAEFANPSGIAPQALTVTKLLKALEEYGATRVLSNPRITALNNQQAVFTFAQNKPFFTVSGTLAQQNTTTTTNQTVNQPVTITSTLQTVPIGIILSLQPSINVDSGEITINIRPTLSKTNSINDVPDPAVAILGASLSGTKLESKVPTIDVKELDTMLKIKSGDIIVLGGLISHTDSNTDSGLPFFSRIPILGNLVKKTQKSTQIVETVILLQASIIPTSGYYHEADKKLYNTYTQDPRPLNF